MLNDKFLVVDANNYLDEELRMLIKNTADSALDTYYGAVEKAEQRMIQALKDLQAGKITSEQYDAILTEYNN